MAISASSLPGLPEVLELLRAETGRLELDARRCDERGLPQLAGDLRAIRRRFVQILETASATRALQTSALTAKETR